MQTNDDEYSEKLSIIIHESRDKYMNMTTDEGMLNYVLYLFDTRQYDYERCVIVRYKDMYDTDTPIPISFP